MCTGETFFRVQGVRFMQRTLKNIDNVLCSGVLSETTDSTVKVWSVILPRLLSLAVRLGVVV
jgi:hypothetical protein